MIIQHNRKNKTAASIIVEPYENVIEQGIKLVEKVKGSGFLSGITKIIVEHNMDHHYGRVFSNKKDTIYISGDRIKSEFSADPLQQVYQIASTIIHEFAHIKDDLKNGEGPSESAEAQFLNEVQSKMNSAPDFLDEFKKIASLNKNAAPEDSGVSDSDAGKVFVTTSARISFRKANQELAHIPNKILNPLIAEKYKELPVTRVFKAKNGTDMGEQRGDKTNKMIGIKRGNLVAIVSVKGQFPVAVPMEMKKANRDSALNSHRGWLTEHFFDMFIGQFAIDPNSADLLREYVEKNGGPEKVVKYNPHQLSQFARSFMAENQAGQITRDPGLLNGNPGTLAVPVAFPDLKSLP